MTIKLRYDFFKHSRYTYSSLNWRLIIHLSTKAKKNKQWMYIGIASIVGVAIIVALFFLVPAPSNNVAGDGWVQYDAPVMKPIEGKYEVTLSLLGRFGEFESGDIFYTRDGVQRKGYYYSGFISALDYLKINSLENSTIFAWWDYGNMIIGYGEREAIAINPSERLLLSVTNSTSEIETDPDDVIDDLGKALTTEDSAETLSILKKYNSEYLLMATGLFGDEGKAKWIFYAGGIPLDNMDNFWLDGEIVGQGRDTILYKMLNQEIVDGFKLIYSDQNTRIYQISS